jgi:hypothetical protein
MNYIPPHRSSLPSCSYSTRQTIKRLPRLRHVAKFRDSITE